MNKEINDILNNIDFENNKLIKINENLYLTNNQIDILKRYNIDYEEDIPELEELLDKLSERNYYEFTNK